MFKTDHNYIYSKNPDFKKVPEYKISPNDILVFEIYTNNGFNLINSTTTTNSNITPTTSNSTSTNPTTTTPSVSSTNNENKPEYLVDADGNAKLPIIGKKHITGLTVREVENFLEECYSEFYNRPFVVAKVTNRRVVYFPGNTSEARLITLTNDNITLLQLIASQGGISPYGKAGLIKLIRDVDNKHEVYHIDLSTIKGVDDANMVLQANDVVYVDPRSRISAKVKTELYPIISLATTTLLLFFTISRLK